MYKIIMKFFILLWFVIYNVNGNHFFYKTQWINRVYNHVKNYTKINTKSNTIDTFYNDSYSIPECFEHLSLLL